MHEKSQKEKVEFLSPQIPLKQCDHLPGKKDAKEKKDANNPNIGPNSKQNGTCTYFTWYMHSIGAYKKSEQLKLLNK